MAIPSIAGAKKLALGALVNERTICCINCKTPMWKVSDLAKYGTKWSKKIYSLNGTPDYNEYWAKDQKTALRLDCPHCGENYFKVILGPNGMKIPKVWVLEEDGFA